MSPLTLSLVLLLCGVVSPAPVISTDCMYSWLRDIGLKPAPALEYRDLFLSEEVTESVLRMITSEQLNQLGVTKTGHRTLIHYKLQTESMCLNSGVCVLNDTGSSFSCSCPQGYSGQSCSLVSGCGETVCKNDGVCSLNHGKVVCSCRPGYSGLYCEIDPCQEEPCDNGGVCSVSGGGYLCHCPAGFEGVHCETMWLNHSSFIKLSQQVALLETVYKETLLQKDHTGPRFFVRGSPVGVQGVVEAKHLTSGSVSYLLLLSDVPTQPQLSGLYIYRYQDNNTLSLVHTLTLPAPTSFTPFTIGDSWYVAVVSITTVSSKGQNSLTAVYKWTGELLALMQILPAPGARDVDYVRVSQAYQFLTISCGSDVEGQVHNSRVYVWYNGRFVFYQLLTTQGGEEVTSLQSHSLLAVASQTVSTLYQWNGTYFDLIQELPSADSVQLFNAGSLTFVLTVGGRGSALHHYQAGLLTPLVSTSPALTATHLLIHSEHFIAFGRNDTIDIQLLDGGGLRSFQTIPTPLPCRALTLLGENTLAASFWSHGTNPNTVLYNWTQS